MRIAKVDRNQTEIVKTLREMGCAVAHTHMVGNGYPDITVSLMDRTWAVEIKDGKRFKSQQKLTFAQEVFHSNWRAKIPILTSVQDAIDFVNKARMDINK